MIAPAWPIVLPGGRGEAGDVGDDRLRHVLGDVLGRLLLGVAADLADSTISSVSLVGLEQLEDVDEARAGTGSPPMPTIDELPKPRWASSLPIW
jgi:hypothetical protein